jgi:cell division protein FtsB
MRNWPKWLKQTAVIAGLFILVLLVMEFNARLEEMVRLNTEVETVRAQTTQVIETQRALMTAIAEAQSENAVEEWAYEEGGYIRDGDHLLKPLPDPHSMPTSSERPTPAPEPMKNWQVWWQLFFGE